MAMDDMLVKKIDDVLPQTQCRQCGFTGCRPYAEAIVLGQADINQCPPGDAEGVQKIAAILGVECKPLNTTHGIPKSKAVAFIDESSCIGCTFCLRACPVDAIIGAPKQMHTIVATECTGCELCVAPCPVDCIHMIPVEAPQASAENYVAVEQEKKAAADRARSRYQFRLARLGRGKIIRQKPAKKTNLIAPTQTIPAFEARKKQIVQAAIQRAIAARAEAANKSKSVDS